MGHGCADLPSRNSARSSAEIAASRLVLLRRGRGTGRGLARVLPGQPAACDLALQRRDVQSRGRVRMEFQSGEHEFSLGVTDIRLYCDDHVTPDPEVIERVGRRLEEDTGRDSGCGPDASVPGQPDEPALHWLQVNNIHFADQPCWRLD